MHVPTLAISEATVNTLPQHAIHERHGAHFAPFAGWNMPIRYPLGVKGEHLHTRAHAGLFDVSHMRNLEVAGPDAADLLGRLCPYLPHEQQSGTAKYTFFLNDQAGILDDLIVTKLAGDRFLVVANAANADGDQRHLETHAQGMNVAITAVPRTFVALQGPDAEVVLRDVGLELAHLAFMDATETDRGWFISRTGYTGEDGFEIGLPNDQAPTFLNALAEDPRVELAGLGARDSLRLEAALPLHGHDMDPSVTPLEAGLVWAIPKTIRSDGTYLGAAALAALRQAGKPRARAAFLPEGKAPVREGVRILTAEGRDVGVVTSGGFSPVLGRPIALALIVHESDLGPLHAELRGRKVPLTPTKPPFVPHRFKR